MYCLLYYNVSTLHKIGFSQDKARVIHVYFGCHNQSFCSSYLIVYLIIIGNKAGMINNYPFSYNEPNHSSVARSVERYNISRLIYIHTPCVRLYVFFPLKSVIPKCSDCVFFMLLDIYKSDSCSHVWANRTILLSPEMRFPTMGHFVKCRLRRACAAFL